MQNTRKMEMKKRESKAIRIGWAGGKARYDRCEMWIRCEVDENGDFVFSVLATDGTGYAGVGQCVFILDSWECHIGLDSVIRGGLGRHKLTGTHRRWLHLPVYGLPIGNFDSLADAFKAGGMDGRLLHELKAEKEGWMLIRRTTTDCACEVYSLYQGHYRVRVWTVPIDWSFGKDAASANARHSVWDDMHDYLRENNLSNLLNEVVDTNTLS